MQRATSSGVDVTPLAFYEGRSAAAVGRAVPSGAAFADEASDGFPLAALEASPQLHMR